MPKKVFQKREVIGKLCIEEVRVDLEHLCSCSWKQCKKIHGSFYENNYPFVYIGVKPTVFQLLYASYPPILAIDTSK